jgi:hypothetical protein
VTIQKIDVQGDVPEEPPDKVEAMAMFARHLCSTPAEGIMLLLTAAIRVSRQHSDKSRDEQHEGIVSTLPFAEACCDQFWPQSEEETLQ